MERRQWYVVQTKPRHEDQVASWLQRRSSVPLFLPKLESLRRWRRQSVRRVEPLFPSYLFVRMSLEPQQWNAVRWAPGVRRIVGSGEVPVPVPDDAVKLLQDRCEDAGFMPWEPKIRPGSQVRITDGPLAGLVGIFDRPTSRAQRVCVLLTLLQTVATVEVDVVDLEEITS
jgi:transcriptional antiterminator RfaH